METYASRIPANRGRCRSGRLGMDGDDPRVTVNVPAGTGDWFGSWDGDQKSKGFRYANRDATDGSTSTYYDYPTGSDAPAELLTVRTLARFPQFHAARRYYYPRHRARSVIGRRALEQLHGLAPRPPPGDAAVALVSASTPCGPKFVTTEAVLAKMSVVPFSG